MSEEVITVARKTSEPPPPRRRPKKIVIPRRVPSVVIPEKKPVYITPDKTTCVQCTCYPTEDPWVRNKKIKLNQKSPLTLYELAAVVVDKLRFPSAFDWSETDVANWFETNMDLPQYKECIFANHINGIRLLMLEDPSKLAAINIKDFDHMKIITSKVRQLFAVELIKFARSVGLPPRKPLTHTTWFKSRTGPSWGIRRNWTRCDILRWMKILNPEPQKLDHWDLVWYQKPDFPHEKFARVDKRIIIPRIPIYKAEPEPSREYMVPRKFKFQSLPDSQQFIWMEKVYEEPKMVVVKPEKKAKKIPTVPKETRLVPKRINLTGLTGKRFILARRLMPKPKFFR